MSGESGSTGRVLIVEPDASARDEYAAALARLGPSLDFAEDAEDGWRAFAAGKPAVVILRYRTPRQDAPWFLRRLQNEYMGTMPRVYFVCSPDEFDPDLRQLEPSGVIVPPIPRDALAAIVGATRSIGDTRARQARRLRDLYDISLLGSDYVDACDHVVARIALTFEVDDAVLWGPPHESIWPRTALHLESVEAEKKLLYRCDLALVCGAPVVHADEPSRADGLITSGAGATYLAAPVEMPGRDIGALCLATRRARLFSTDERDALQVVAKRLSGEMSWVAAHSRLVDEHERLRETSLLDPLLGVWTRSALEQSIASEIGTAARRNELVSFAIIDVNQLREINDRYGHVAGDAALAHIAQVVRGSLRNDDVLGRFGGDEFGVLLPGTDLETAQAVLRRVVQAINEQPLLQHGIEIGLGITIGATEVGMGETSGEPAMARAVRAVRRARRTRAQLAAVDPRGEDAPTPDGLHELGAEDALPAGSTLGGMYRILHEISRGAMGVVYRGEDLGLARPVAIKVLRSDLAQDDDLVAQFREEAAMLASLSHVNLVQVYSFGTQGDDVYFVMELVEGEPLTKLLSDNDAGLPLDLVSKVVTEIAGALDSMHSVGLIHRDVKPANLLLDRKRERAVLVDVGVAKRRGAAADAAGTPGFAAPESFLEDTDESQATDVYGLASTTYTLLTGTPPFGAGDVEAVVRRQLYETPTLPSELRRGLAAGVDKTITRALAPEPGDRYASASAFARDLAVGLAASDPDDHSAPGPGVISMPGPPKHKRSLSTNRRPRLQELDLVSRSPRLGNSRGALFRVLSRVVSKRLSAEQLAKLAQSSPEAARVLSPNVPALGWHSAELLLEIIAEASDSLAEAAGLARAIGRATIAGTLARFMGANPRSLSPGKALKAAEAYWVRYHDWGRVEVELPGDGRAQVAIHDSPGEPILCALITGQLERIVELTGAAAVEVTHPHCAARDSDAVCRFAVQWREPAPAHVR